MEMGVMLKTGCFVSALYMRVTWASNRWVLSPRDMPEDWLTFPLVGLHAFLRHASAEKKNCL